MTFEVEWNQVSYTDFCVMCPVPWNKSFTQWEGEITCRPCWVDTVTAKFRGIKSPLTKYYENQTNY